MANLDWIRRKGKKSDRDDGSWKWYEDIEPTSKSQLKLESGHEHPLASAPFDPAPPIHTSALSGSW
jgi:hypothetical protein